MVRFRSLAVDIAAAVVVLFGSLWVYEFSNLASLAVQGVQASMSVVGGIPLGVVAVTPLGPSPLTKVLQVAIAASILIPVAAALARSGLLVAEAVVLSTVGAFLASFYWEMLSVLSTLPLPLHEAVFLAITGAVGLSLFRVAGQYLPHQGGARGASPPARPST